MAYSDLQRYSKIDGNSQEISQQSLPINPEITGQQFIQSLIYNKKRNQ